MEFRAVFGKARSLDDAQRNAETHSSRSAMSPATVASCQPASQTEMQCQSECLAVKQRLCSSWEANDMHAKIVQLRIKPSNALKEDVLFKKQEALT